jgi:hypothetical protein
MVSNGTLWVLQCLRSNEVHCISDRSQVPGVEVRVGPQEDRGVVSQGRGSSGDGNSSLSQEAGGGVAQHVGRCPSRQTELDGSRVPHVMAPMRQPQRLARRCREQECVGIGTHVELEVHSEFNEHGCRHLDDPGPVRLGVPLEDLAAVLAQGPFDGEASQVIEVSPPQGCGFLLAEDRSRRARGPMDATMKRLWPPEPRPARR